MFRQPARSRSSPALTERNYKCQYCNHLNYNGGELLRSCVDSLLICPLEIETIVIDNASSDGSLNALMGLPCVQIIKSPAKVGFTSACNSGEPVPSAA
jgi:GT2 family glycosyltransferase